MIQAKEIRKPKPLPPIDPDEVPYGVPVGWEWVRLGELSHTTRGISYPGNVASTLQQPDHVVCLRATNLQSAKLDLRDLKFVPREFVKRSEQLVRDGDIVMSVSNSLSVVGKVMLIREAPADATVGGFMAIIRSIGHSSEFLFVQLASPTAQAALRESANVTTIANISTQWMQGYVVPLPPIAEQERIVEKVEELMRLCDELETAQREQEHTRVAFATSTLRHLVDSPREDHVDYWELFAKNVGHHLAPGAGDRTVLTELRRTILDLAVRGRLTEQDPTDEPASVLLERIRAERERMIQAKEIRKPKLLPPIHPGEAPYELPQGWEWVRLGEVVRHAEAGFACGQRNLRSDGYPHLRTNNVGAWGEINLTLVKRIDPAKVLEHKAVLEAGDVLFNNTNSVELVGKSALVRERIDMAYSNHITVVRGLPGLSAEYLRWQLVQKWRSGHYLVLCNKWIGQAGVPQRILLRELIALPPTVEQHRIVAKVDELMRLCDELEAQFSDAEARRSDLAESIARHAVEATVA